MSIPARFLRRPRAEGYGPFLLHDLRRRADGELDPAFPLNSGTYQGAEILVARRNFGGGSSREAAVYALVDHGIFRGRDEQARPWARVLTGARS